MNATIKSIIESLNDLEESLLDVFDDNKTMNEIWGWNYPALSRHDLASIPRNLSNKLKEANIEEIDEEIRDQLSEIVLRVEVFKSKTLQYLFTGNAHQAAPVYLSLMQWISETLNPLLGWETLQDNKVLPAALNRRLRAIQTELNEIIPEKEELIAQIKTINDATEAAESLPTDLESLKEARNKVSKFSSDSAELYGKIDSYHKKIEEISNLLDNKKEEADRIVAQCEEAYRITTTKGLAAAFDQRANNLSTSMWIWVLVLIFSLFLGVYIGSLRFEVLRSAMANGTNIWYVWIQIFLSILSLGAPIWLAWLATKQINQRFKLSEDYAFKASVAKAYEGYRKEAARIDKELESRLFDSALTRLEEAPLRLMETEHHGSPWHELISSKQFKDALDKMPDLKGKVISLATNTKAKTEIDSQE